MKTSNLERIIDGLNEEKRILSVALSHVDGSDHKHNEQRSTIESRLDKIDKQIFQIGTAGNVIITSGHEN